MLSTLTSYTFFQRELTESAAPSTPLPAGAEAEIRYWRETIKTVTSAEAFVDDARLYDFATKAFGFGDDAPLPSVMLLAMEGGSTDRRSLANTSSDYRIEEMTRQFAFFEFGVTRTRDPNFIASVEARYRIEVAKEQPGARAAVRNDSVDDEYFRTRIGSIDSPEELLADFKLYTYALSAFDLQDMAPNRYLIEQVLSQGADSETDLANEIGDPRLQNFATAFRFHRAAASRDTDLIGEKVIREYQRTNGLVTGTARDSETDATGYFRENIGKVSSLDDLMADQRLYTYVMTAFDLAGEADKRAIVRKSLEEGAADRDDFANRFNDPRFAEMARFIALEEFGPRNLQDPAIIDAIAEKYERVQRETDAGEDNFNVQLAAYFDRKAGSITSWYSVLADTRLRDVVFTALALPEVMKTQNPDKLAAELEQRFDIEDFQDPEQRAEFLRTFAVRADLQGGLGASTAPNAFALTLFGLDNSSRAETIYGLIAQL